MENTSDSSKSHPGRSPGLGRALLLTAASAAVPGTAHLFRGRRLAGSLLLLTFVTIAGAAALLATRSREQLVGFAVNPELLLGLAIGAGVLALAWMGVVVWSYRTARPPHVSRTGKAVAGLLVGALCVLVCAPLALAAHLAQAQRGLVTQMFPDTAVSEAPGDDDPWSRGDRLNVLLLGGDADAERRGVRTDVMILASVDPATGNTVLLSLPRNMENAPMPFRGLRQRFPHGYPDYLYGLWRYGVRHPNLVPGNNGPGNNGPGTDRPRADRPGATLLTATVERITGVPVDYYALVDLDGFESLVDALGGVWIEVTHPIPYGTHSQFVVEAGYRQLTGREALWYARSRTGTSDYDRMRRQRCLLGAIANQADPVTVVRNFRALAQAAKRTVETSIPRALLPELLELAPEIKRGEIANVQFVPPLIDTSDPDYAKIRRIANRAITQPRPSPSKDAKVRARAKVRTDPDPRARNPHHALRPSDPAVEGPAYMPAPGGKGQPGERNLAKPRERAGTGPGRIEAREGKHHPLHEHDRPNRPQRQTESVSLKAACPRTDDPG